jgi:hypothetical protein
MSLTVVRRGRAQAGRLFPMIKPETSDWKIRSVLEGANADTVRREAERAGFRGQEDVLLCFPRPSPSSPQRNQALGLLYIGEAARQFYGFRVAYWDARHDPESALMTAAARANVIGFSAITGFQLGEFVRLATQIKATWPDKPILLGGAHATLTDPHTNLADPLVDYVAFGEGELRLPALLRALYNPDALPLVDGIGYRTRDGRVVVQPTRHVPDLERDLPVVVNEHTLRYFKAAAARNEMILPSSRGCPWSTDSCDFCSVTVQYMDSYRRVPFRLWREAIETVHREVPFTHMELEDENSAIAIKPSEPYLPLLKSLGISCHLHLRSDQLLREDRVRWMADMGVTRIHIGVESGSDRVLNDVMHKHERVETHHVAARNLARAGIEMVATYIVANPTETWPEIRQTLQLAEALRGVFPPRRYRATVYVLAAFPGTPIFSDIRNMRAFCRLLDDVVIELQKIEENGDGRLTLFITDSLEAWVKRPGVPGCSSPTPKAADTVQPALQAFLNGTGNFLQLQAEAKKWLWPMPDSLRQWAETSAAANPFLPPHWNAIYSIAGMHFNRHHKGKQNFPGWKRILIAPFDFLFELRFRLATQGGFEWALKGAGLELWLVARLLSWASKRSVGVNVKVDRTVARARAIEGYSETMAGH